VPFFGWPLSFRIVSEDLGNEQYHPQAVHRVDNLALYKLHALNLADLAKTMIS
jgi:hypothetical protein